MPSGVGPKCHTKNSELVLWAIRSQGRTRSALFGSDNKESVDRGQGAWRPGAAGQRLESAWFPLTGGLRAT